MTASSFRPIEAVSLGDEAELPPVGPLPEIIWVDPRSLVVDERYQRSLSRRSLALIRQIATGWDWAKFTPPICSRLPDGRLAVDDGQHTSIGAASHPGVTSIPVLVTHSVELEERAASFLAHNTAKLGMTAMQLHHAAVAAGDPVAVGVQRAADAVGIAVLRSQPQRFPPSSTIAVSALAAVYRRVGEAGLVRVLTVLKPVKLTPIGQAHLRAVTAVLFDREYVDSVRSEDLTATITGRPNAMNEASVLASSHRVPLWKALAVIYFRHTRKKRLAA